MNVFSYTQQVLHAEAMSLEKLAQQYDTPCYIYSRAAIEQHWRNFSEALGNHSHLICYAVKANANLAVLNVLARLGSGFDIVSQGELERVLAAGGDPKKIVFSGVGKTIQEMQRALEVGIKCFNIESEAELELLGQLTDQLKKTASISIRVNPDVDAKTHPYIATGLKENKFGIEFHRALDVYKRAQQFNHLNIAGIDCHIGSQLTQLEPFVAAVKRVLHLIDQLKTIGIQLAHIDMGGGLGVCYRDETPPSAQSYIQAILDLLKPYSLELIIEPGRSIVANAGLLLTRVQYLKKTSDKHFAIVDAGMNDLIRPALYQAWQNIIPVNLSSMGEQDNYDIVGPVCETGDFLGKDRELALAPNALLAVLSAGAYGFAMSSNYNSRNRLAEVMVDGDKSYLIRRRETFTEQMQWESTLPI